MNPTTLEQAPSPVRRGSLRARLINIFAAPGDVFDEVLVAPPRLLNWLVPTLLVCLAWLYLINSNLASSHAALLANTVSQSGVQPQPETIWATPQILTILTVFAGAVVGTCWSAFVLWFIGRIFLRTRFSYSKTLEIVGLVQMILLLGTIVTVLLSTLLDQPGARPGLSLVTLKLDPTSPLRRSLEVLNVFHLWSSAVLSLGLSRLSGATYKECAFWVFGYWILFRLLLAILG